MRRCAGFAALLVAVGVLASCAANPDASLRSGSDPSTTTSASHQVEDGDGEDRQEVETPGTDSTSTGSCTVEVTGDFEISWNFSESVFSVSTDYWMSEDDLRQTVELLGEDIAGGSYDELVSRGQPIVTFLTLTCVDEAAPGVGAQITHTNLTEREDLPMGPGTYEISGGMLDADGPGGTMIVSYTGGPDELYEPIPGSGSLVITRWDVSVIEGNYTFEATEVFTDAPRHISVSVVFSHTCREWHSGC